MASDVGLFDSPFSRTRSLFRTQSTLNTSRTHHRSLSLFSHKNSSNSSPRAQGRSSTHPGPATPQIPSPASSPSKKSTKRGSKRPGKSTIGRAVSTTTACATLSLSSLERDMATLPNEEILSTINAIGRTSPIDNQTSRPALSHNSLSRTSNRSRSSPTLSTIKAGTEMTFSESKSPAGTPNLNKAQKEYSRAHPIPLNTRVSTATGSVRSKRPQIQVVIPQHHKDRPLPTSPFFSNSGGSLARSASAEPLSSGISPPSGSNGPLIRNSTVSPLDSRQQQPGPNLPVSIEASMFKSKTETAAQNLPIVFHSSSEDSHGDDGSSTYSPRSSRTSIDEPVTPAKVDSLDRSAASTFAIASPGAIGVFENEGKEPRETPSAVDGTEIFLATQVMPPPRRYAPHNPIEDDVLFQPTCSNQPPRSFSSPIRRLTLEHRPSLSRRSSVTRRPTIRRKSSRRSSYRRTLLNSPTMGVLDQAIFRSELKHSPDSILSPTLSEAETELEQQLRSSVSRKSSFEYDGLMQRKLSILSKTPGTPPAVPRKSSKRQSLAVSNFRLSRVPNEHIASQLKRSRSSVKGKGLKLHIPGTPQLDDFHLSPLPIPPKATRRTITPNAAENVILSIFQNLETLNDLFATAIVNAGFYRVFKRYELDLMQHVLRKMSPPAWEHREICYPGHDQHVPEELETVQRRTEYTASSYVQHHMNDMHVLSALKALINQQCRSFLRPEISRALNSQNQLEVTRVDDALWRIWTFCKIFGCSKGREEDIVAQMDWLKGGPLVHQNVPTHAILSTDALDMNDTLANAPECFAMGNEGGLSAEELFDMMELWNCLAFLIQPIGDRRVQARQYGVFDNTDVRGGDVDGEELMLDEWYYYLLTLGLSPILALAGQCHRSEASVFTLAQQSGWMDWKAPEHGGTRRNFLKEAASRVYEDKIAITYAESSTKEVQRQMSKQRIQRHIEELRERRNNGERLPEIRMSQERPMSEWEGVFSNLTRARPPPSSNLISHIPSMRSSALVQDISSSVSELPASEPPTSRPVSVARRIVAQPLLPTPPPSTVPSVADRSSMFSSMPSIDEHPAFRAHESIPEMPSLELHPAFAQHLRQMSDSSSECAARSTTSSNHSVEEQPAFQQHPLQRDILQSDPAENSADKAVYRIVEMGFTPEQARSALRRTDLGDGLRVDRAVELLLREQ